LFLIYIQKYYYASSINKLCEVSVCARVAGSRSCTCRSMKQNALCYCCTALLVMGIDNTLTANFIFVLKLKIWDLLFSWSWDCS